MKVEGFTSFFKDLFSLRERETERARGGRAEREGERESQAGFVSSAQGRMWGSTPWMVRSRPEPKPKSYA